MPRPAWRENGGDHLMYRFLIRLCSFAACADRFSCVQRVHVLKPYSNGTISITEPCCQTLQLAVVRRPCVLN